MTILPTTSIGQAWALVRRNGDQVGKRPSTRMAFLTGTIAVEGRAVAFRGYIMNNDLTSWTRHTRRVEFQDVLRTWRFDRKPSIADVKAAKAALPVVQRKPI